LESNQSIEKLVTKSISTPVHPHKEFINDQQIDCQLKPLTLSIGWGHYGEGSLNFITKGGDAGDPKEPHTHKGRGKPLCIR